MRAAVNVASALLRSRPLLPRAATTLLCIAPLSTRHELLPTSPLPYRGLLVEPALETTAEAFAERLPPSIEHWMEEGHSSAMIKLPIELSGLAAVAATQGFEYHHAEGSFAVLKKWLQPSRVDKVPPRSTHQVGAAGLVIDEHDRILVVREWRTLPDGERVQSSQWKLPGGLLERGEAFEEGVGREVREETGIETRFDSIVAFWHRHGLAWGQSDLYFVARLTPTSPAPDADGGARGFSLCPDEISDAKWMPLAEFVATQDHPLILSVLRRVYGIGSDGASSGDDGAVAAGEAEGALPLVEMVAGDVQWPGRQPYRTYFGNARASE